MIFKEPNAVHSFQHVPARKEILTLGTTHVSVDFVDLTTLLFSLIVDSESDSRRPLLWIGYESSPHAVAKSLVVAEMLLVNATVDHILQVCYSSAWTRETSTSFKTALNTVVAQFPQIITHFYTDGVDSKLVLALLKRWQITDVSLGHSYDCWLNGSTHHFSDIANYMDVADRMALAKYKLTGQLGQAQVGSITMFASLPSIQQRVRGENVLKALPLELLHDFRETSSDIVAAAISLLRDRILGLLTHVRQGSVILSIRAGQVDTHLPLQEAIKILDPYTISWHCVPDLHNPKAFHEIATKCSGRNTIHTMTSIQWSRHIKGASIIDYADPSLRSTLLDCAKKTLVSLASKTMPYLSKRLLSPPCVSPFVCADYCLGSQYYMNFVNVWKMKAKIGAVHYFPWSLFGNAGGMHVSWTYNQNIELVFLNDEC